jgi:CRP-like cAMP-binding protein
LNAQDNFSRNRLLAMLAPADRTLLAPALEGIELSRHQILAAPNDPIGHVYFVESGLVSLVGTPRPGIASRSAWSATKG